MNSVNDPVVFYVDDDQDDRELFHDIAKEKSKDISVYTYDQGEKLLAALKNPPPKPECVFVDLNMPGISGFEVIEEIRKADQTKDVPVVVISTSADTDTIDRCRELGASYYIPKSNDYKTLTRSIQHALSIDWDTFEPGDKNFVFKRTA